MKIFSFESYAHSIISFHYFVKSLIIKLVAVYKNHKGKLQNEFQILPSSFIKCVSDGNSTNVASEHSQGSRSKQHVMQGLYPTNHPGHPRNYLLAQGRAKLTKHMSKRRLEPVKIHGLQFWAQMSYLKLTAVIGPNYQTQIPYGPC